MIVQPYHDYRQATSEMDDQTFQVSPPPTTTPSMSPNEPTQPQQMQPIQQLQPSQFQNGQTMNAPMDSQFQMNPMQQMHFRQMQNTPMNIPMQQPTQFQMDQSMVSPMDAQFQVDPMQQMQPMQPREMSYNELEDMDQMQQSMAQDQPQPPLVNMFTRIFFRSKNKNIIQLKTHSFIH